MPDSGNTSIQGSAAQTLKMVPSVQSATNSKQESASSSQQKKKKGINKVLSLISIGSSRSISTSKSKGSSSHASRSTQLRKSKSESSSVRPIDTNQLDSAKVFNSSLKKANNHYKSKNYLLAVSKYNEVLNMCRAIDDKNREDGWEDPLAHKQLVADVHVRIGNAYDKIADDQTAMEAYCTALSWYRLYGEELKIRIVAKKDITKEEYQVRTDNVDMCIGSVMEKMAKIQIAGEQVDYALILIEGAVKLYKNLRMRTFAEKTNPALSARLDLEDRIMDLLAKIGKLRCSRGNVEGGREAYRELEVMHKRGYGSKNRQKEFNADAMYKDADNIENHLAENGQRSTESDSSGRDSFETATTGSTMSGSATSSTFDDYSFVDEIVVCQSVRQSSVYSIHKKDCRGEPVNFTKNQSTLPKC